MVFGMAGRCCHPVLKHSTASPWFLAEDEFRSDPDYAQAQGYAQSSLSWSWTLTARAPAYPRMSASVLIEAVEVEGFGGGGVVAPAFGDVQVAGVFDGGDDSSPDRGQVDGPAAGPAAGGVFAERHVPV